MSSRAAMNKSRDQGKSNYEARIQQRAKEQELKERTKAIKTRIFQQKVQAAQRRRDKEERKKLNQMKSAKV